MPVTGEIVIGPEIPAFEGATAYVDLQDVSRADAPARRIGRARIDGVGHEAGREDRIRFEIAGAPADPRAHYALRVHVAKCGAEDAVAVGDLVSTEHVGVTPAQAHGLVIRVRPVG